MNETTLCEQGLSCGIRSLDYLGTSLTNHQMESWTLRFHLTPWLSQSMNTVAPFAKVRLRWLGRIGAVLDLIAPHQNAKLSGKYGLDFCPLVRRCSTDQGTQCLTSGSMDLINTEGLVFEDLKPQVKVSRRDLYLNRAATCFLAMSSRTWNPRWKHPEGISA